MEEHIQSNVIAASAFVILTFIHIQMLKCVANPTIKNVITSNLQTTTIKSTSSSITSSTTTKKIKGREISGASIAHINIFDIPHLSSGFNQGVRNDTHHRSDSALSYNKLMGEEDFIIADIVRHHTGHGSSDAYVRAGYTVPCVQFC